VVSERSFQEQHSYQIDISNYSNIIGLSCNYCGKKYEGMEVAPKLKCYNGIRYGKALSE
jgi:hypothetical protein